MRALAIAAALILVAGSCSSDDDNGNAADTSQDADGGDEAGGESGDDGPPESGDGDGPAGLIVAFDAAAAELAEGVAVGSDGSVYASLAPLGQLVRATADGHEVVGTVEGLVEGDLGLIGITVGPDGAVYGGVFSTDDEVRGVWRFDVDAGTAAVMPGTDAVALPNDVAFDDSGNLYISDTIGPDGQGGVWRVDPDGNVEAWASSELLGGDGSLQFGFPIGANGIDVNGDAVLVAVTERAHVVRIPIEADGSAGEAALFADLTTIGPEGGPALLDGLATGNDGEIYVTALNLHSVFEIDAGGTDITAVATADDGLDAPSSVEVTADGSLYIASFSAAIEAVTNGQGSSIIKIPG